MKIGEGLACVLVLLERYAFETTAKATAVPMLGLFSLFFILGERERKEERKGKKDSAMHNNKALWVFSPTQHYTGT